MSTRALQIEALLDPVITPAGAVASGYTVYFYEAGTTTAKNVWTEKEKTNPFTSKTLGSDGTVQVYGDGNYKIVIKDTDGDTVYSWDNIKIQASNFSVVTKTTNYTATPDDDVILVDTSGGNITISLQAVANFVHPLTIKNTGTNTVTIDPDGSETIDGQSTQSIGTQNNVLILYPDNTAGTWRKASHTASLEDLDGDTYIKVEASSDEDKIRMGTGGTERLVIDATSMRPAERIDISNGLTNGTNTIDFPTNGMADAKVMLGNSSTIAWFYLNAAPPGWKVVSSVFDVVLAVSGGSEAYNVNGGNVAGETWANLQAHKHGGSGTTSTVSTGLRDEGSGSNTCAPAHSHTYSFTTGGSSVADVRPTAAVGKLFQLDTA